MTLPRLTDLQLEADLRVPDADFGQILAEDLATASIGP
jgi:hypothetical protein